jgi:predicted ATPase
MRGELDGMLRDNSKSHTMRTLFVKNFPAIKEARIVFGRITVIIGPQASGKSLLCKLAFFLGGEIPELAVESLLSGNSWNDFIVVARREFESRFSTSGWMRNNSIATFTSDEYRAEVRGKGDPLKSHPEFTFSDGFEKLYTAILRNKSNQLSFPGSSRSELRQDLWIKINMLLNPKLNQAVFYIPFGRSLFTDPAKLVSALQNPDLDWITRRFAGQIFWDSKWKVGLLSTGRDVIQNVEKEMAQISGGRVGMVEGKPQFLSVDGRRLPLDLLSSGTLEMLPMFSLFSYLAFHQEHYSGRAMNTEISHQADVVEFSPLIYLEEPETGIFPRTQYEIVKLFAWFANDPVLSFDWSITTHSPYILSSFNNLLQAWQVGSAESASLKVQVERVIDQRYWIDPNNFRAYCINDGKLESIIDTETNLINGKYLDSVSNEIGAQFDELLRIGYDKE